MYCLAIGYPNPHYGGGGRRSFEVLKHLSGLGITPILHIPHSDLMSSAIWEEVCRTGRLINVLRELEHFNVIIPGELYESLENISLNMQHYLDKFRYKRLYDVFLRVERSVLEVKNNILSAKRFLERFIKSGEMNLISRLQFVYSIDGLPSFVVAGAFWQSLLRRNYMFNYSLNHLNH
ncbi:MAG: hypothetical protein QW707_03585 [Candidatus Bathyarchaeia archaeon]